MKKFETSLVFIYWSCILIGRALTKIHFMSSFDKFEKLDKLSKKKHYPSSLRNSQIEKLDK